MRQIVRYRQPLAALPTDVEVAARQREGWKLVALEWERDIEGDSSNPLQVEVPYGLRVASDCRHLEEDGDEMEALTLGMELLVSECPFTRIADELNRHGHRTREGTEWTPVLVFNLLPRLIEVGPRIFPTREWAERREKIFKRIGPLL
jgi:hypothetical protein